MGGESAVRARQALCVGRRLRLLATRSNAHSAPRLRVSLAELTTDEWLTGVVGEEHAPEIELAMVDGSGSGA